jgi:choline kinase
VDDTDIDSPIACNARGWKTSPDRNANRVKTALLLAAGTGSRLRPLTLDLPKCLADVSGISILGRLLKNLRASGIRRLVVVTGHLDRCVRDYLALHAGDIQVEFVSNPIFATTNNIYSLWLAREVIQEPFLLIESDLVLEDAMLQSMLTPNKIAVSPMRTWMNGTTVELNGLNGVLTFNLAKPSSNTRQYKTVNIYSLGLQSWRAAVDRLSQYVAESRVGVYYENVFADMVEKNALKFDAVVFDEDRWCEIDTLGDLTKAEMLFPRASALGQRTPLYRPLAVDPSRAAHRAVASGESLKAASQPVPKNVGLGHA